MLPKPFYLTLLFASAAVLSFSIYSGKDLEAVASNAPEPTLAPEPVAVIESNVEIQEVVADETFVAAPSEKLVLTETGAWPVAVVHSLKLHHEGYEDAIDFIERAVEFEDFAALPAEQADRLIRYAQSVRSSSGERILHLCWGHDTAAQVVAAFEGVRALALLEANEGGGPLPIFEASPSDRWSNTATDGNTGSAGTPVTITWSFAQEGTSVPNGSEDAQGNDIFAPSDLIAKLNDAYGPPTTLGDYTTAPWFVIFTDAFESWEEVTGNTYVYEPNDDGASFPWYSGSSGVRGDVRIGGTSIDGNSGTLAFNYFPNSGDMVIDSHDSSNLGAGQEALLENVLAHEHGHGLGFDHVCPVNSTKLMEPFVSLAYSGPQFDDIYSAHGLYGDPFEPKAGSKNNETPATAYDLGVLDGIYTNGLVPISISNSTDVDVYSFEVIASRQLNITLSPTSEGSYLEGQQNQNGSCSSGTSFDPSIRQNLSVRVLDTDGVTVLGSADVTGIGQVEILDGIELLQPDQSYFVEISGGGENSGDSNNAQAYDLELEFINDSEVQLKGFSITNETCSPSNGTPDPDEWITASILVQNLGTSTKTNVAVTLMGDSNLSVQGSPMQTISSLGAGATTTLFYTFSLSGNCLEETSVTFRAESGPDLVDLLRNFTLGSTGVTFSEDVDTTSVGSLPTGFTQTSDVASSDWDATAANSNSSPNSLYSRGVNGVNSSILTSPILTDISAGAQLSFEHQYDIEEGFDGGILEISIDGGAWVEWTAAGGSFVANGYDEDISTSYSNPLGGLDAWTGNSGSFVQTIADFPASAVRKDVQVRWHQGNDSSARGNGWWIDDIEVTGAICCESQIPQLSVLALDSTIEELNPATTGDFIITSDINVSSNLAVAYTLSGDAVSGSDFVALAGSATILSGQTMVSVPVTVIADSEIEGDETLTMNLSASGNYGIITGSANMTIKDLPFDEYRFATFGGATVNIGDDEDFDFDGLLNLVEYAFRLDADGTSVLPFSLIVNDSGSPVLELVYYEDTQLEDVTYIVETSSTLQPASWTTIGVTITDGTTTDGLFTRTASIPIGNTPGFIRIRIERIVP